MSEVEHKIFLKDILSFDELKKQYPDKKIKLRFNTGWKDTNSLGQSLYRDYCRLYKSDLPEDKRFFRESIMSVWSKQRRRLSESDIVFQFIEIKDHIWLLVDAVKIIDTNGAEKGYNAFTKSEFCVASGERLEYCRPFIDRLTVSWKNKPRQFFYTADKIINSVEVNEILPCCFLDMDEDFCGYENISKTYNELKSIIDTASWRIALSSVYGVYVITDLSNGSLYVGSATGEYGIYGRWSTYLESGYDEDEISRKDYPNKQLREIVKKYGIEYIQNNFQYSVLEIFPKSEAGKAKAYERESYWKKALATKDFGYNDN